MKILKDYDWRQIIEKETKYYLKLDKGGYVIQMATYKISESQAKIAIANEISAAEIVKSLLDENSKE